MAAWDRWTAAPADPMPPRFLARLTLRVSSLVAPWVLARAYPVEPVETGRWTFYRPHAYGMHRQAPAERAAVMKALHKLGSGEPVVLPRGYEVSRIEVRVNGEIFDGFTDIQWSET